jgi:hypothetical protein
MPPDIQKLVDRIESQRDDLLKSFRSFSQDQFNKAPAPGRWSAAEILSHLIAAERLSLAYMQKKVQGIESASISGPWEEIKMAALKVSQRLPGLKFKAPKHVVENTARYRDLVSIESEWVKVRADLRALLEKIPQEKLNRLIYKHPVAGYLNARHAVAFFHEHIRHHLAQLRSIQKK